jgi:GT2 family glycosyltransferase
VRARDPRALEALRVSIAREHESDWVSGSCLLIRRSLLERLSGFDERFFLYEEDVDLCARGRQAGFRVVFTPSAHVVHALGRSMDQSSGDALRAYDRSHILYYQKHRGPMATLALRLLTLARTRFGAR